MNTICWFGPRRRSSLAVAALAVSFCVGAQAEYVCNAPPSQADKHACELAKRNRPDELRLFIQRTSGIYGFYFYDYVDAADVGRWHAARPGDDPLTAARDDHNQRKSASR